jgi:hypothetical protein
MYKRDMAGNSGPCFGFGLIGLDDGRERKESLLKSTAPEVYFNLSI